MFLQHECYHSFYFMNDFLLTFYFRKYSYLFAISNCVFMWKYTYFFYVNLFSHFGHVIISEWVSDVPLLVVYYPWLMISAGSALSLSSEDSWLMLYWSRIDWGLSAVPYCTYLLTFWWWNLAITDLTVTPHTHSNPRPVQSTAAWST